MKLHTIGIAHGFRTDGTISTAHAVRQFVERARNAEAHAGYPEPRIRVERVNGKRSVIAVMEHAVRVAQMESADFSIS